MPAPKAPKIPQPPVCGMCGTPCPGKADCEVCKTEGWKTALCMVTLVLCVVLAFLLAAYAPK